MPSSRLASNAVRLYVRTGPAFGDDDCIENRLVKLDLVVGDFVERKDLQRQAELVQLTVATRTLHAPTLTVQELLKSKLHAFAGRMADNDKRDIVFLVSTFPTLIQASNKDLDQEEVQLVLEKAEDAMEEELLRNVMKVDEESGSDATV